MTTFLAIQHTPTGYFLPEYGSRKGRGGYTNDEPQDPKVFPPRIFRTSTAARNALRWWLEGIAAATYDWEGNHDGYVTAAKPNRKAKEMRIVEVEIRIVEKEMHSAVHHANEAFIHLSNALVKFTEQDRERP